MTALRRRSQSRVERNVGHRANNSRTAPGTAERHLERSQPPSDSHRRSQARPCKCPPAALLTGGLAGGSEAPPEREAAPPGTRRTGRPSTSVPKGFVAHQILTV
ncbi:unnamed protein product [Lampetra fluviatilis]